MRITIPCIDCIHYNECAARKICVKDFLAGRINCFDYEVLPQFRASPDHLMPLGAHLFTRDDGRYSLPDTDIELKSLTEEYLNAIRPNILLLLQICEQLTSDKQEWVEEGSRAGEFANWVNR